MPLKRKGPLEIRKASPEEWEALGLPRSVLVVSSTSSRVQYGKRPRDVAENSPSGQKPPEPSSKKV